MCRAVEVCVETAFDLEGLAAEHAFVRGFVPQALCRRRLERRASGGSAGPREKSIRVCEYAPGVGCSSGLVQTSVVYSRGAGSRLPMLGEVTAGKEEPAAGRG